MLREITLGQYYPADSVLQEEGKKVRSEADVVRFLIWAEAVEELLPEAFI